MVTASCVRVRPTGIDNQRDAIERRPSPVHFYHRWILACAVGELIGIGTAAAAATAIAIASVLREPQSIAARVLTLATFAVVGAVEGGALSALQWRVLRTRLPRLRAGEWIGVTVAIAVIGWIAGMTPSTFSSHGPAADSVEPGLGLVLLMAAGAGAAAGLCFGGAQWLVLRHHAQRAHRWIWVHIPAWGLAMAAIFLAASLPTSGWPIWTIVLAGIIGGILVGVLLGAVTGLVARDLDPWVDEQRWSMAGKVCAVTGANSGIGYETALGLARLHATVILLCRRPAEGEEARRAILARHRNADVHVVPCDLANLASVRAAGARLLQGWPSLDVLIHNAGATFAHREITTDGIEATLAVDVMGPFLLTALLHERLEACHARVIALTGIYQRRGRVDLDDLHFDYRPYDWLSANNQAQRGRLFFVSELARRAPAITTAAVHPGAVLTRAQARLPALMKLLIRTVMRPGFVRAEIGAMPVVRLAALPTLSAVSGRFFNRYYLAPDAPDAREAQAFWAIAAAMVLPSRTGADS